MTAECLGLEYNFKQVDIMAGEHMQPKYLAINPQHTIPTMVDGEVVLNESRAIAAYLVNKYGKNDKLYPKDPVARARVDQRLYFDMGVFYEVSYLNQIIWLETGMESEIPVVLNDSGTYQYPNKCDRNFSNICQNLRCMFKMHIQPKWKLLESNTFVEKLILVNSVKKSGEIQFPVPV